MKIKEVTDEAIIFDNGNTITYDHDQDCCEHNYADFSVLNESNVNYNFDFNENLLFKFVDDAGFMFGSGDEDYPENIHWIFIPCYSEQNGYYTNEIDIYYTVKEKIVIKEDKQKVVSGNCEQHNDF